MCRSIHYDLKESDIVTLFSSFGTITKSEMSMDSATGKSKGFCFLEYTDQASALAAHAMDGFELAGRKVR
jgi:RNA recognition motif-containing protein